MSKMSINAGAVGRCPTLPQKRRYRMKFEMEQCILAEMAGKAKRIASDSLPVEILRGVYLECDDCDRRDSLHLSERGGEGCRKWENCPECKAVV